MSPVNGPVELSPGLVRPNDAVCYGECPLLEHDANAEFDFNLWEDIVSSKSGLRHHTAASHRLFSMLVVR